MGDQALILPLESHRFYNTSKQIVIFEVEVTDPKELKNALQLMYGLAKTDRVYKNGLHKNILHTAIGLHMMDAYTPGIPLPLQKIGISILAYMGRIFGIEKKLMKAYCN